QSGLDLRDRDGLLKAAVTNARVHANLPWLRPALRADDIRRAHAERVHALFGMAQYNDLRPGDLDQLDEAHALGLRSADCAYNVLTFFGAGCTERTDPGLSRFGQRFVERCIEHGVIFDTAHIGL